jgi:hypothetical protein
MHTEEFGTLQFPRRHLAEADGNKYRVYSSPAEYKVVRAKTAAEALKASGLPRAIRIRRDSLGDTTVLDRAAFSDEAAAAPAPKAEPDAQAIVEKAVTYTGEKPAEAVPEVPSEAAAKPAEAPTKGVEPVVLPDVTLSKDDVDKLLSGEHTP